MLKRTKNVSLVIMLFVITLFQITCLFTLVSKASSEHKLGIILTFGIYILVEYIYFIGTRLILKRKGFEVELIALFFNRFLIQSFDGFICFFGQNTILYIFLE